MRVRAMMIVVALVAGACSSETAATTSVATIPTTSPPPTTATTQPVATTTTTSSVPASSTTTTSLFVPPPECTLELPDTIGSEVTEAEIAVFADAANPMIAWRLPLGDRPVRMSTLGDRVYLATFDGFVASFDIDPCGLDWLVSVPEPATGVIAARSGVFVTAESALVVLDRLEGTQDVFPLEPGRHEMAAGPDVLAVTNGDGLVLYDYVTREVAPLATGFPVDAVSAATDGVVVAGGITVELKTWLGADVWSRDMPDPVKAVRAVGSSVVVGLTTGSLVALDLVTGEVQWEAAFGNGATLIIGPVERGELHVLELDSVARHHHLAIEDGSSVFVSESPVWQTFAEYDDGLILVFDEGDVTARSLLEQDVWTIATGADGLSRFTEVDVTSGFIVALSYSAERF
ncbi:MAG: PQQ-binding-like beta-propeller repeat protein [Acidimicrobiia bacterium]|nr:PQQ-binding-like beta-propeller repeat protein [Acidimicrobiia bacterium]